MNTLTKQPPTMVEDAISLPAVRPEQQLEPAHPAPAAPPAAVPEQTVKNIAGAIAAITAKIGVITKRGVNQFHHYKYASMQDILQKLTPLLAKHGLVIMQTEVERSMFDQDRAIAIKYAFTILHSSGEVWPERLLQTGSSRCKDSRGAFDDKAINKCHTAARKYFLLALFQIATGEEDDADEDKPNTRPISTNNLPPHDVTTGELDDAIPAEWDDAKRDPPKPVDFADPLQRAHDRTARFRSELEVAAESGSEALKRAWHLIPPGDRVGKDLEAALRACQKRANEIDEAAKTL